MAGSRAKMLKAESFDELIDFIIAKQKHPERDIAMMALSHKTGLRACEMAGLNWINVLDADGSLSDIIEVPADVAKKGHARGIPMHPFVREALVLLKEQAEKGLTRAVSPNTPLFKPTTPIARYTANNLQRHMGRIYRKAGFIGCSSHSGRRGFITHAVRRAGDHDASLHDVQRLAGHRYMDTTQKYIEPSEGVRSLVSTL